MNEHPIPFSDEMVQAILAGVKTQTRRVINPQPLFSWNLITTVQCPFGYPGDHLWVKETCNIATDKSAVMYRDGGGKLSPTAPKNSESWVREWKTLSSRFMPRWASRITLEIVNVRVERLQQISDLDCEAEGIMPATQGDAHDWLPDENGWHRTYRQLWNSINAKRGFGWDTNPWVWVIEFRRLRPQVEFLKDGSWLEITTDKGTEKNSVEITVKRHSGKAARCP